MNSLLLILTSPCVVWILAYIYLAFYYKKWNIFSVKIHETGKYTLLETILYFNHFLREIIIDTLFVFNIYWIYLTVSPDILYLNIAPYTHWLLVIFLFSVFMGSIWRVGLKNTLLDFLQYRALDNQIDFGSHWRMHFLSTLILMLIFVFPATLFETSYLRVPLITFVLFIVFSVLFRTNVDVLINKRWLMHGGREVLTFFFIGFVPAYLPILKYFPLSTLKVSVITIIVSLSIVGLLFYYLFIFRKTTLKGLTNRSFSFLYLMASHFFEHALDFIYMTLLMLFLLS